MPTDDNGVLRYNVRDEKDLAHLIETGLVWRGGPTTIDLAIDYLNEHPEAVNDKVPASVLAYLQPAPPSEDELAAAPPAVEDPNAPPAA